ncbi:MAG: thiamine pyrophosphate-dependent enzyme [Coriobacteriales bacterium]
MRRLCMGNEAIGIAAIAAGVNVVCGYPGTPSTEIVETIARLNPDRAVHVEWSTNEKAALELAAGASYAGARVIMTCKQVGLNVASDPLMSLAYVGTRGGLVIVAADDPGPISSQTEQDTRQFGQFAHVPVLDPATPEEAYAMTQAAFELSEAHGCPVILRPTTRVDHGCASIEVPDDLAAIPRHPIAGFERDPRFVIFPPLSRRAHGRMFADLEAMADELADSPFNRLETVDLSACAATADASAATLGATVPASADDGAHLGIACGGDSRGYVREALGYLAATARATGVGLPRVRLLEVGTPMPFPTRLGRAFLEGLDRALVVEELEPVIERNLVELEGALMTRCGEPTGAGERAAAGVRATGAGGAPAGGACAPAMPVVSGRLDHTTPVAGEYSVDVLLPILAAFLGTPGLAAASVRAGGDVPAGEAGEGLPPADLVPPRPPVLCAGCPHRASFLAVKAAVGARPAAYSGDIGCYTLGCGKPLDATDTCLCMGAGVTVAQGLETAARLAGDEETLHVGFVGDSTFFASAMTGIANAVYNGHRMCLCVLDNSTTAMTGSQPHPGTGVTLMGERRAPISIPEVCRALGAELVEVVDPLDADAAQAAARRALDCPGVSVVVFRSPCIQLYCPLEPVCVDADACTGCGSCVRRTGCPALSMSAGPGGGPAPDGEAGPDGARATRCGGGRQRGRAQVDASLCVGCDLCVGYCPFGAIATPRASATPEERDAMRREALRG